MLLPLKNTALKKNKEHHENKGIWLERPGHQGNRLWLFVSFMRMSKRFIFIVVYCNEYLQERWNKHAVLVHENSKF